jgi:hypothetical protein
VGKKHYVSEKTRPTGRSGKEKVVEWVIVKEQGCIYGCTTLYLKSVCRRPVLKR